MARRKPRDVDFYTALAELSERELKIVNAYVMSRVCVKGCGEDEMEPAELMRWLTTKPGEIDAA